MKSKCLLLLICLLFLNGCSLVILGITQNRIDALQEKMLYRDKGVLFAIGQDKTLPFQSTANKEIIVHVKVKSIKPLSDAEKAALMAGDEIIFVNGKKPNDIIELFFNDENKPIKLTVLRGNYKFETILMPL